MQRTQEGLGETLRLIRAQGLGPMTVRPLLEHFGDAARMISAGAREWKRRGLSAALCEAIAAVPAADIESDLRWLQGENRELLLIDDPRYPEALRRESSAPIALFVRGDAEVLARPQLAIVGSRNATVQGLQNAAAFASELSRHGLVITSGLALGIDGAAHQGALDAGGLSVGVCATGLDRVYPAAHRELAHCIAEDGALVSEFPPGVGVRPEHFPRRNRIISALSLGVLVVEAAEKSGSLITGRYAAEQGRELFAIPGSIHNPMARGCHQLIRNGAKLVENAADIFEEIADLLPAQRAVADPTAARAAPEPNLSAAGRELLAVLADAPCSGDQLIQQLGWSAAQFAPAMLELELAGFASRAADGSYMRCATRT